MPNWEEFRATISQGLGIPLNPEQEEIVRVPANDCLWVVAGPGSGKTTALALRVLKLILVDGLEPSGIIATTFTRKAAAELRSRVLGWGDRLCGAMGLGIEELDLNQIVTGTLDSIVKEILSDHRLPGLPPPTVIEDFVADGLMVRAGLLESGLYGDRELREYLGHLRGSTYGLNIAEIAAILREIRERILHDQVSFDRFRKNGRSRRGVEAACEAIQRYEGVLTERLLCDYAELERAFLEQLDEGSLDRFLERIRYVLVDEYQDTNRLQEQIYFRLAKAAFFNGGGIAVVGDDDQSLFRFRGTTVGLFRSFPGSLEAFLSVRPHTRHLFRNYRSTPVIVNFVNQFVSIDPAYQDARVSRKPPIQCERVGGFRYPILGLFREDARTLSRDLAKFTHAVVYTGYVVKAGDGSLFTVKVHTEGSPGDIAVLCDTPEEYRRNGTKRLPVLLREDLGGSNPPIKVFNPRGQRLERIPCVMCLCGLILECLDPGCQVESRLRLPQEIHEVLGRWRSEAQPLLRRASNLLQFVTAWQRREPVRGARRAGHTEVSLVDLVYKLVTWIPEMQNDVEGLVYLEAVTRAITQSALVSDFQSKVVFEFSRPDGGLGRASVVDALRHIFAPLAAGAVKVEEDLLETLPADRINVMSIHQAKGLEFPVVVVDVGSDFKTNHHRQAFRRFPREPGKEHILEDELRRYSVLGMPARPQLDRAFDDLIRKFFVAYSRAQDLLVLIGLNSAKRGAIRHIAVGWARDGSWPWRKGLPFLIEI